MNEPFDFVCTTAGHMIVCPETNTPCSPMCALYIERGGYAICDKFGDESVCMVLNSSCSRPWKAPAFPEGSHQVCIHPDRTEI